MDAEKLQYQNIRKGIKPEKTLEQIFAINTIFYPENKAWVSVNYTNKEGRLFGGYQWVSKKALEKREYKVEQSSLYPYTLIVTILDFDYERGKPLPKLV